MSNLKKAAFLMFLVLLVVCLSLPLAAQNATASIHGTVTDVQDHAIPNATVTITSLETNAVRSAKTDGAGDYIFDLLSPGDYKLEVLAPKFKKSTVAKLHASVAKTTDQNFKLSVGATAETVEVTADNSGNLVNTQDATIGNNFDSNQITQLPLEARNVLSLLTLQPGVTSAGYVSGARSDQSNVTLDGVDINESQTNALGGAQGTSTAAAEQGPVLRLNAEAIEEFRVTTANSTSIAGRSSAAQINLVTKSGSNTFHGALFESHRNQIFSANNYFNNKAGVARPKLIRNTFGGAIGGPIVKDKLFFFFNYEGRRDASGTSVVRTVPTATLGQGIVIYPGSPTSSNPGGSISLNSATIATIFPSVGVNPAAVAALAAAAAKYPANDFTVGDSIVGTLRNTSGFRFNASTPVKLNSSSTKIDFVINNKQTLFVRGNYLDDHLQNAPQFPDTPRPGEWDHPWGIAVGHTWLINDSMSNNFHFGITRQAFTQLGDSLANAVSFRFVYSPLGFSRNFSRTNPVTNFVDDFSWTRGKHVWQFGANVAVIRNGRTGYGNAFDNAITNPSFYPTNAIRTPINNFSAGAFGIGSGFGSSVENAVTAIIGRFSQYTANFTFGHNGSLLPSGTATIRDFANWGFEGYVQDSWKATNNLTLTLGLRYGLWRPVYEKNGFETKPNIPLGTYFENRLAGAAAGVPYFPSISVNLSGSANGASPLYHWDKTNFQPRVAAAWTPNFENSLLSGIFGKNHESVLRGGFTMSGDYYGQAVAAFFDTRNTLGFGSNTTISANTYNVTTRPGPLFTGFGQAIRPLPGITVPGNLVFPQSESANNPTRIESSLDENLQTPKSYSWSFTFERKMPGGLLFTTSYVGRMGRHLLAQRDVMAINNLVDPKSKMDWYTAATILEKLRHQGVPWQSVAAIPYFENIFSNQSALRAALAGNEGMSFTIENATQAIYRDALENNGNDWTTTQLDIDNGQPSIASSLFYQPQYGALTAFSSIGNSNYHGLSFSLRERYKSIVTVDFNYTYAHSLDDSSGLQSSGAYGAAFILNPIQQRASYASSDFDIRHLINMNAVIEMPIGKGKMFFGNAGRVLDAFIGGWQVSNIFRWNTGLPVSTPYDDARWATNWNVQSSSTATVPLSACPTRGTTPKLFGCNTLTVYQSLRNAYPGETGQRNYFRTPGYVDMDMGLGKTFKMPYNEHHALQARVDAFNISNTQRMGAIDGSRSGFGIQLDPNTVTAPPPNFSNFTGIQGSPRVLQGTLRYSF